MVGTEDLRESGSMTPSVRYRVGSSLSGGALPRGRGDARFLASATRGRPGRRSRESPQPAVSGRRRGKAEKTPAETLRQTDRGPTGPWNSASPRGDGEDRVVSLHHPVLLPSQEVT
jgi:hypothetical protein